ncbi:formate dehydrogenase accessory sulfurtransferase FdhD [Gordonia sp. X0973]|uniref:formate dehydrogenase accessory sulfurtransferase FdhD n=1 Tax=Gordonia sp. X0973 TaxID=2742602 RepID=UPI000F524A86|nr:formate dehydrogenase accessory sulfurtransferase FdhD [Gordonia sp. X0973]QKT07181.1 formate dehydrogenase accessory sulfurtransferase FdhD [Gordonia sp. X0973]
MGRITVRRTLTKVAVGREPQRRIDTLAVEEPLEIRVSGTPLTVTMRTPGDDVNLAAGFLVSEGIISDGAQVRSAIHCDGPRVGRPAMPSADGAVNQYNILNVVLASDVAPPAAGAARNFYTTSACGLCGKTSIDAVRTVSSHDLTVDSVSVAATTVTGLPNRLRVQQAVFEKTGGLHAAALFDVATDELLVLREDVGRHNAVDKVIGWAALAGRLPLRGTVLQVSGRASFELVQKAVMAGIPILAAVSAPSSLAVELAQEAGLTLIGFVRGESMNTYSHPQRIA